MKYQIYDSPSHKILLYKRLISLNTYIHKSKPDWDGVMFKLCITILVLLLQTCHKLSGLKQQMFYSLRGLEAQSLKSRCQWDPALSGGWRGASFHIFHTFGEARLPWLPWLVATSHQCVPPSSHHLFCVSPFLCFKKNLTSYIYLFIFGHTGSSLLHSAYLYLERGDYSLQCMASLVVTSLVAKNGLYVAHGLSCSMACGIFPDQGSPLSPSLAGGFLTNGPPKKSSSSVL